MDDQETKKGAGFLVEVKQKGVVEKHRHSDRERALQELRRIPEEETLAVAEVNTGRTPLVEKKKTTKKGRKRSGDSDKALPDSPRRVRAFKRAILFGGILGLMLVAPLILLMGAGVEISTGSDFVPAPQAPRVDVELFDRPAPEADLVASETLPMDSPLEKGIAAMISAESVETGAPGSYPYTVHAGSFRSMERAGVKVEALREKGQAAFAAYVEIPGMGGWVRVFCGNHTTKEDAQACKEQLKALGVTGTSVVKKSVALAVEGPLPLAEALALESRLHAKGFFAYAMPRFLTDGLVQILVGAFQTESRAKEMLELLTEEGFQAKAVKR